ncbi:ComEC/Rec2 family competence protein [Paenibacillus larvae]|uniref:Beta-lactamase domain-containing protein n=4 Tax=Paenibacillus larvae TaxID=1464 RepID=V9WEA7_9BACL|nr:ComEC/Rec2 family competence protein [Paenibacillus larvae]AHD07437.1 beta-lactamase domain-containing protein [Paenibacillus larvae subsp. larvae DSM 25430]AQR79107.1 MBL fold metallo-hydrolase [Paenibacillus larvae subsp. larvae]ARF68770.1 MBL fold metallo-hydrolase [Paenibacillus larvae subsp. pulvifaciens]AVF23775.1 beta-lactamase domain-containing protein [Paenibacillus larvae subsp. larvae]AVG14001.1 beta-lactamase domain-containing protein [Paenibacillus larvae subsp. larvae DSM 2543
MNIKKWLISLLLLAGLLGLTGCTMAGAPAASKGPDYLRDSVLDQSGLKVLFLDVGQGASQLLVSPNGKTMLIDAGDNDKEQLMLDYMKKYGITKLDIVIGTHPDADHIGGLDKVIDHLDIGKVYLPKASSNTKTYESLLTSIKQKGLKVTTAKAGVKLDWDPDVQVEMLAPVKSYKDNNNNSAVVRLTHGANAILLTGDAESESEQDMIASKAELSADLMLVGHHGSNSSTTAAFLNKVKPKAAVIQVGKGNKYGHPKEKVLQRLEKQGVKVYRNDEQGTIAAISDGKQIRMQTER